MHICLYPYSEGSGTGTYVLELADELQRLGHTVTAIGTAREKALASGVHFIQTPREISSQFHWWSQLPPFSYWDFYQTTQYLRPLLTTISPDVFHMSTHMDVKNLPCKAFVTGWDYPKSIAESCKLAFRYSKIWTLPYRIFREIEMSVKDTIMYRNVSCVIGINQHVTNKLVEQGIHAVHIPPGISLPDVSSKSSTLTLCFVARNHIWIKRKGLRLLLDALLVLKQTHPTLQYNLHIIGRVPWYSSILFTRYSSLHKHITVHGLLPRKKLMDIVSHAHIQVIPSVYEEFGYSAIEAMARGTALICSKGNPSFAEMVGKGGGIATNIYNASVFAKDLGSIMQDKKVCDAFGIQARARVRTVYDISIVAQRLIREYQKKDF